MHECRNCQPVDIGGTREDREGEEEEEREEEGGEEEEEEEEGEGFERERSEVYVRVGQYNKLMNKNSYNMDSDYRYTNLHKIYFSIIQKSIQILCMFLFLLRTVLVLDLRIQERVDKQDLCV